MDGKQVVAFEKRTLLEGAHVTTSDHVTASVTTSGHVTTGDAEGGGSPGGEGILVEKDAEWHAHQVRAREFFIDNLLV